MKTIVTVGVALLLTLAIVFSALAQTGETTAKYRQRQEVIFDDVIFDGWVPKPGIDIFVVRHPPQFAKLIQVRHSFIREMHKSLDQM